jgi:hypothetical protein
MLHGSSSRTPLVFELPGSMLALLPGCRQTLQDTIRGAIRNSTAETFYCGLIICNLHIESHQRLSCWIAEVKATETVGPVLIHVLTEKGRGYLPAETASDRMHGVGKYDVLTGKQVKSTAKV